MGGLDWLQGGIFLSNVGWTRLSKSGGRSRSRRVEWVPRRDPKQRHFSFSLSSHLPHAESAFLLPTRAAAARSHSARGRHLDASAACNAPGAPHPSSGGGPASPTRGTAPSRGGAAAAVARRPPPTAERRGPMRPRRALFVPVLGAAAAAARRSPTGGAADPARPRGEGGAAARPPSPGGGEAREQHRDEEPR